MDLQSIFQVLLTAADSSYSAGGPLLIVHYRGRHAQTNPWYLHLGISMYAGTLRIDLLVPVIDVSFIKLFSNYALHYSMAINVYIAIPSFTKYFLSSAFIFVHFVAPRFT